MRTGRLFVSPGLSHYKKIFHACDAALLGLRACFKVARDQSPFDLQRNVLETPENRQSRLQPELDVLINPNIDMRRAVSDGRV